jgi:hypothetical protein
LSKPNKLSDCKTWEEAEENFPEALADLVASGGRKTDVITGDLADEVARLNPIETVFPEEE